MKKWEKSETILNIRKTCTGFYACVQRHSWIKNIEYEYTHTAQHSRSHTSTAIVCIRLAHSLSFSLQHVIWRLSTCTPESRTGYINFFVASSFAWRALVVSVVRVCGAVSNGFRTHSVRVRCSYRSDRFIFLVFSPFLYNKYRQKRKINRYSLPLHDRGVNWQFIYSFEMKTWGHQKRRT